MRELQAKIPASNIGYVKRIDNVIFSHAGLTENFVEAFFSDEKKNGIDCLIDRINDSSAEVLWTGDSPIWSRPQFNDRKRMYMQEQYMQVVGHTPMREVTYDPDWGLLSTDVWSTYKNGQKYGEEKFVFIDDTVNKTWKYA